MPLGELPRKLIVRPAAQDKLDLVASAQRFQVFHAKRIALT